MSDTPWYGTVRQKIMSILLAPAVRLLFKLMWVPGSTQYEYARRLGYANNLILRGLYCADDNLFAERFRDYSLNNKTLIFLGRLVSYKGIELICKAFCEMERSTKEGWKLVVAGNGNNDYLFKTPVDDVIHIPFLQPKEAAILMAEADAFILASDRENWGVTVHEAALSGLVLCLTEGICSSESYLIHGYNGFYIKERSVEGIKETLSKLFSVSDDELKEMKKRSNILGHKYSKELWAATLVGASHRDIIIEKLPDDIMCGITGIVSQFGAKGYVKERSLMIHALRHRGPDAMDEWYKPGVQLGHTRLSIIDLSEGGNQPKTDYSFRYTITFNGEIYNYKELKLKLKQYPFQTQTDTEVILAAYSYWGYETPTYLKGQFAFAIWDDHKRELFLARDRMGEKPLYYYVADGVLVFASEMRALLGTGLVPKKVSLCGVYDYLLYQSVASPNTIIENVFQLKQGHFAIYTNSTLKSYKYYDICEFDREVAAYTYEETTKNISDLLTKAVEGQMVSDVPLGAFLSGGIDLSVIVGIMASISTAPVHTVSVTFDEAKYDESRYSDLISKRFNTNHTKPRLKASDFLLDLDRYFADLDVPSGDAPNTWMVSRATKKTGLTVALSGLGGDELFAGYKNFTRYIALKDNLCFWKFRFY